MQKILYQNMPEQWDLPKARKKRNPRARMVSLEEDQRNQILKKSPAYLELPDNERCIANGHVVPNTKETREQRIFCFWKNIQVSETGCWEWMGHKSKGYGIFTFEGKRWVATRLSLKLHGINVPDGMLACHHCDNPPCVNPDHLFIGTVKDNSLDCVRKGRSGKGNPRELTRGVKNHRATITDEMVLKMREMYHSGMNYSQISRYFNIPYLVANRAIKGTSWFWLNPDTIKPSRGSPKINRKSKQLPL